MTVRHGSAARLSEAGLTELGVSDECVGGVPD
jgi:hypothetical protein